MLRFSTAVSSMTSQQTEVKYILLLLLLAASSIRLSYSKAEMLSGASGSQEGLE